MFYKNYNLRADEVVREMGRRILYDEFAFEWA